MNKETVIISTMENLHERIARLEKSVSNNGKIGTFISAGDPTEEFAQKIVSRALQWFSYLELEPSDLFRMATYGLELEVPSVRQVKDLEAFIRTKKDDHGGDRLYFAITQVAGRYNNNYYEADMMHGIKIAMRAAYGITAREPPPRSGQPAHAARGM